MNEIKSCSTLPVLANSISAGMDRTGEILARILEILEGTADSAVCAGEVKPPVTSLQMNLEIAEEKSLKISELALRILKHFEG